MIDEVETGVELAERTQIVVASVEYRLAPRIEATFRIGATESAIVEILALGPHVELIEPAALRTAIAQRARATAALYTAGSSR